MALYQKLDFIRSTIYVENFIIVSRSAQNAQFFALYMLLYYNFIICVEIHMEFNKIDRF